MNDRDIEFFRRFNQIAKNAADAASIMNKFFGTSALEVAALEALQFGITENGKKVRFRTEGYIAICKAIARGEIVVLNNPGPGADASYDDVYDRLLLPPGLFNSPLGRSKVVHELTHAIVDLTPATGWSEHTNECAAFIAQAIYLKVTKTPVPQYANDAGLTAIHREARALVDSFGFGDNTLGYFGIIPTDPEMFRLRKAVAAVYSAYKPDDQIPLTVFGLRSSIKIEVDPPVP